MAYRSTLSSLLFLAVFLTLGLAVTWYWLSGSGIWSYAKGKLPALFLCLVLAATFTATNIFLRWLRWHFLTRITGVLIPARDSISVYLATLPAIVTPFYTGELVRIFFFRNQNPVLRARLIPIWMIERFSDMASLLIFWAFLGGQKILTVLIFMLWVTLGWLIRVIHNKQSKAVTHLYTFFWVQSITLAAWLLPIAAMRYDAQILDLSLSLGDTALIFSKSSFLGALSGIPQGIGVTGSIAIPLLREQNIGPQKAALLIFISRFGTAWFAVLSGICSLWIFRKRLSRIVHGKSSSLIHFDRVAPEYSNQFLPHFIHRMIHRKIDLIAGRLAKSGISPEQSRGLDIGCGQGWYTLEMIRRGFNVEGLDQSPEQVNWAKKNANAMGLLATFKTGDVTQMPYNNESFDFVYGVNIIHHITHAKMRSAAFREISRILKSGGVFFMHEMNTTNPLFRFYMAYVFPLLKYIDEGTEQWMDPADLPHIEGGTWSNEINYFTFLPDFTPEPVMKGFAGMEKRLENSRFKHWSAHFLATWVKH